MIRRHDDQPVLWVGRLTHLHRFPNTTEVSIHIRNRAIKCLAIAKLMTYIVSMLKIDPGQIGPLLRDNVCSFFSNKGVNQSDMFVRRLRRKPFFIFLKAVGDVIKTPISRARLPFSQ